MICFNEYCSAEIAEKRERRLYEAYTAEALKNIANICAAPYMKDHKEAITLSYVDVLQQYGSTKTESNKPPIQNSKSAVETAHDIFRQMRKGGRKNRPVITGCEDNA